MSDSNLSKMIPIGSGKVLAKNTIWNLLGQGLPIVAAIFSIPLLIKGMGVDRFGILTLAWMVIGYFSLFDFGIGRALTKVLAENIGKNQSEENPAIIWTALSLMSALGVTGAVVIALLVPLIVTDALKIPVELRLETANTFYLLAASIPFVINTVALRGVLEAYERFDLANKIRLPMGLFMFIGPIFVLLLTKNMAWIVFVLIAGRVVAWVAHIAYCRRAVVDLKEKINIKKELIGPLLRTGGWMTVSNLVGPVMVYLDRFLIGANISMAAVAYYTTPQEIVTRVLILPAALTGVLFPAFASALVKNKKRAKKMFDTGLRYIFIALYPITLVIVIFAAEGLNIWLGAEFSKASSTALQCLAVGVLFNGLAQVPYALVQASGRSDLTAKLHLFELPFYILILYVLLSNFGIDGAAIAWLLRASIDAFALFFLTIYLGLIQKNYFFRLMRNLAGAMVMLVIGWLLTSVTTKAIFSIVTLLLFTCVVWKLLLDRAVKAQVKKLIGIKNE